MNTRNARWGVAARLLAIQLCLMLLVGVAVTAWSAAAARSDVEREAVALSRSTAWTLATAPFVVDAVGASADPAEVTARLQPYTQRVLAGGHVDFITVMDTDRTRYTHPDPERIGGAFVGSIDAALRGDVLTETFDGTLGPSVRAVAPVRDAEDRVIALVAAGTTLATTQQLLSTRLAVTIGVALAVLTVCAAALLGVGRYLHQVTRGGAREQLDLLFAARHGIDSSRGDGLVLQADDGRLLHWNARAAELLGIDSATELSTAAAELLGRRSGHSDAALIAGGRILRTDRERFGSASGHPHGGAGAIWITTVRDDTDVAALSGEVATLTAVRDALRSQNHEFANRLHTMIALIEVDRAEEAVELALAQSRVDASLAAELMEDSAEPVLAALLIGKSAEAAARGIELTGELDGGAAPAPVTGRELITIVGNLVDNALDAAAATPRPTVRVRVDSSPERWRVRVGDSGRGPLDGPAVFELGTTAKAGDGHGVGLALVRHSVLSAGGTLRVDGSTFEVVLPLARAGSAT
ncbi:ATP-binding protein [Mycetocola reblochoni]|uniref:sensor histidine kinase n=1 Tax=Mycetocola reblochoni TaxID=331618 RepID=UPI003F94D96A